VFWLNKIQSVSTQTKILIQWFFWRKATFVKHVMEQYVIAKMTLSLFLKDAYNMYRYRQGWTPTCKFIQEYALTLATSVPRSRSTFPTFQRVHIRIGCQYPILRKCCQLVHKVATAFPVPATGRPKICLTVSSCISFTFIRAIRFTKDY